MSFATDLWSVLLMISLVHSLFASALVVGKRHYRKPEGKWLLAFLLLLGWYQLEFLAIRWPYDTGFSLFYGTRYGSWLLLGPVFYYYVRAVLGVERNRGWWRHFALYFVLGVVLPLLLRDFLSYRQVHYGMLTVFDDWEQEVNLVQYVYGVVFIAQFLHLLVYLVLSGRLIEQREQQSAKPSVARKNVLTWLKVLWIGTLGIVVICGIFLYLLFATEVYRRHLDYLYVIPLSLLVYLVSYKLAGLNWYPPGQEPKYRKSGLDPNRIDSAKRRLIDSLERDKLYLDPELRMQQLSDAVGLPPHQLSELLNQHMHTSFRKLVTGYRVEAAKRIIREDPPYNLARIGFESGFNNKTSFVNAFKRVTGRTPSKFQREIRQS